MGRFGDGGGGGYIFTTPVITPTKICTYSVHGHLHSQADAEVVPVLANAGDVIIFDYRVVHRGMANIGMTSRPVLYLTFCRAPYTSAS